MGASCYREEKRNNPHNQDIKINNNYNYYNECIINNVFYNKNNINNNNNLDNINTKRINGVCCLGCGEPAGKNFGGGGKRHNFICMKCGAHERYGEIFYCKVCKSIFCSTCPQKGFQNSAFCPSCGEPGGKNFGGGCKRHNFNCMKCGANERYGECFYCKVCKSIFCSKCPYKS